MFEREGFMLYSTTIRLYIKKDLTIPKILSIQDWEKCFLKSSTRARTQSRKDFFLKCYKLVHRALSCNANHLIVAYRKGSLLLTFEFIDKNDLNTFTSIFH